MVDSRARRAAPVELRPMRVPDLLDSAFVMYRAHFRTLIGIVAVVDIPLLVLSLVISVPSLLFLDRAAAGVEDPSAFTSLLLGSNISSGGVGLVALVVGLARYAALVIASAFYYLGSAITIKEAYQRALNRALPLVGANLLLFIIGSVLLGMLFALGLIGAIAVVPITEFGPEPGALSIIFALAVLFVPVLLGLALTLRWFFVTHAVLLENAGVAASLRRSWQLTSGSTLRIVGLFILAALLLYALQVVPVTLFVVLPLLFAPERLILASIVNSVATQLLSLLLSPIPVAIITAAYFDLRIRREGFDLERRAMRLQADADARAQAAHAEMPSTP
jgi:hypothetical protein